MSRWSLFEGVRCVQCSFTQYLHNNNYYNEVQLHVYLICLYYTIHVILNFVKINHLQVSVFEGIFACCAFTVAPWSHQFF